MTDFQSTPVTVDAIIEHNGKILMIRRKSDTFHGYLALPGGFVDYGETVEQAVVRETMEEVNIKANPIEILGVYSEENRDPRGPVISVIFVCNFEGHPEAGDDASGFEWVDLRDMADMQFAFDHSKILTHYKLWKQDKSTFWSSK